MKVYIVWCVIDYDGSRIDKIFLNEVDAVSYVDKMNSYPNRYKFYRYDSYEVI